MRLASLARVLLHAIALPAVTRIALVTLWTLGAKDIVNDDKVVVNMAVVHQKVDFLVQSWSLLAPFWHKF